MRNEKYASITQVKNGFTVSLTLPLKDKDDWDNREEYIYSTLEESIGVVVKYFDKP